MKISLIRGDGIGPEISAAACAVVAATGVPVEWVDHPVGAAAVERYGQPVPPDLVDAVHRHRACLKGPLAVDRLKGRLTVRRAGGETRTYPSINGALRRELGCYCNLRPLRGYAGISGRYAGLDLAIVREVTEDVYAGLEQETAPGRAEAIKLTTREACERIARAAFAYARTHGRRRVTVLHKANVLGLTDGLFLRTAREVAPDYPDVALDDLMIDAACYHLVRTPERFDVVLCSNQYGDIFSDLAAGLAGSLGLAPGANIGPDAATFEASHGAAPDIAGQGVANPIALILSAALMLEYLGHPVQAGWVQSAVAQVLEGREALTPDLGGSATTDHVTESIVRRVQAQAEAHLRRGK